MTPQLSEDLEDYIVRDESGIVRVKGLKGHYFIMTEDAMQVREHVHAGVREAEQGIVAEWNVEEIINKAKGGAV